VQTTSRHWYNIKIMKNIPKEVEIKMQNKKKTKKIKKRK